MYKFIACLVAVAAISFSAQESHAQFHRGGSGFSIGFSNFGGGFGGFNRGFGGFRSPYYGRSFNSFGGSGFNRGFSSRQFVGRPVYYSRGFGGGSFRGGCGY